MALGTSLYQRNLNPCLLFPPLKLPFQLTARLFHLNCVPWAPWRHCVKPLDSSPCYPDSSSFQARKLATISNPFFYPASSYNTNQLSDSIGFLPMKTILASCSNYFLKLPLLTPYFPLSNRKTSTFVILALISTSLQPPPNFSFALWIIP